MKKVLSLISTLITLTGVAWVFRKLLNYVYEQGEEHLDADI